MNTDQTHSEPAGRVGKTCDTCHRVFAPGRAWSRFCDSRCRNAFHQAEARKDAIRAAALELFEVLTVARGAIRRTDIEHVWVNYPTEPSIGLGARIDQVLGKLKPPVEPKALLDKGKA